MTALAIGIAPVPRHLNLSEASTVQFMVPNIADQVRHLTAAGLGVVQIATRLDITAYTAFAAGAHICQDGDAAAVAASMPPMTETALADLHGEFVWWATHTVDEIAARYDTTRLIALFMQDTADEALDSWAQA